MIVSGGNPLRLLTRYAGRSLLGLFAFDLLVVFAYFYLGWKWLSLPEIPVSIVGGAIGIILGFRNNSSYQRWWEARTLWGAMVNHSRSLARQAVSLIGDEAEGMRRGIVHHQIAYAHALRCRLRGQPPLPEIEPFLDPGIAEELLTRQNVPLALQIRIAAMLRECAAAGGLDTIRWAAMDETLTALANAQGGCERIKNTPLPKQYDYFPRVFVQGLCIILPLGLVADLGIWTPVGSALAGFIFLSLDKMGRELENPFDNCIHDVPMTSICRTIEIDLRQTLGERDVPGPLAAVKHVLW